MGRRIVNDVGRHGWRVVTRGKLVSCTLFAICKLCLVYTRRDETRRDRFEGRRMGKIAVCPRREREGEGGGWSEPWPWSALSSSSSSNRSDRGEGRKHEVSFHRIRCSREARSIRSNKYPRLLGAETKEKRPPPRRAGELHGEKSLRSREPSSPNGETPFFPLFGPTLPLIPPPTCSSPVSNKFWISLC